MMAEGYSLRYVTWTRRIIEDASEMQFYKCYNATALPTQVSTLANEWTDHKNEPSDHTFPAVCMTINPSAAVG